MTGGVGPAGDRLTAAMIGVDLAGLSEHQRAALAAGMAPDTYARLLPGVDASFADQLRPHAVHVRDAITAAVQATGGDGAPGDWLAGDPTADGYRARVHAARKQPYPEAVLFALLHLEIALTFAAHNSRGLALAGMQKAAHRLGVPPLPR